VAEVPGLALKKRGLPSSEDPLSGYIGVQAHTGHIAFRNMRIKDSEVLEMSHFSVCNGSLGGLTCMSETNCMLGKPRDCPARKSASEGLTNTCPLDS
jgi:hypothetical protein